MNQNAFQDRCKRSPESPESMYQSAKDTRDTSDHKCILIQNSAYKYKHYTFLKSEGLVGAVAVKKVAPKATQSFSFQT